MPAPVRSRKAAQADVSNKERRKRKKGMTQELPDAAHMGKGFLY